MIGLVRGRQGESGHTVVSVSLLLGEAVSLQLAASRWVPGTVTDCNRWAGLSPGTNKLEVGLHNIFCWY